MHFVLGVSIKEIARRTGRDRNTIRAALRSSTAPKYSRPAAGSKARSRSERAAWRRSAGFAKVATGDRLGRFGGSGGWWAGEVAVFEAVAVAFEGEDLGAKLTGQRIRE